MEQAWVQLVLTKRRERRGNDGLCYCLPNCLTDWITNFLQWVCFKKLTISHLVKKFPALYRNEGYFLTIMNVTVFCLQNPKSLRDFIMSSNHQQLII